MRQKFGTAPVFFTAISTILGAVMFLRFGYAVGAVGLLGTIGIILIGHLVTIPTALSIAEIATNQKVEGGGEYYIISRSFGLVIGSSIGIALYFSQAISVAFYIIAFSEAFKSLFSYLIANYDMHPTIEWLMLQKQTVSVPALLALMAIVLIKGADLGVKALYVVVVTLFISLIAFFLGSTEYSQVVDLDFNQTVFSTNIDTSFNKIALDTATNNSFFDNAIVPVEENEPEEEAPLSPIGFFAVFAIIFPAFTGMTAGVGLSGDLENPRKSIPLGTLAGTLAGMVVYILIAFKLSSSASPADLYDTNNLVMADIAVQGWWLIPLGLAAATISSALGSIMVAPRTLQAIARDQILPNQGFNSWLSKGKGPNDEPFNSTVFTIAIAFVFVMIGELDFVAQIISMFFMVTYGSLNLISFLQHFAADPAYRPTFRSKWYFSGFGAIACFGLMFFMNPGYAFLSLLMMIIFYLVVRSYNREKKNMALIFQGAIFQLSRQLRVFLQKTDKEQTGSWRPSAICISENSFERMGAFNLLSWIADKYGFGTYIHKIGGYLSKSTNIEAKAAQKRLIKMAESSKSNIYIDTLVSPSYTSAIAQVIQLPGVSGKENNLLLLEFSKQDPANLADIGENFKLIKSVDFDVVILGTNERGYGLKQSIHIWITNKDYENANLMILLSYIILGHKEWANGEIKIFAIYPEESCDDERIKLFEKIEAGQLPISKNNIRVIPRKADIDERAIINEYSKDADLTVIGFRGEAVKRAGIATFEGYNQIGNTIFVNASETKSIK